MSGAAVGLLFGAGLFCLWNSLWPQETRNRRRPAWALRLQDDLVQAGFTRYRPVHILAACTGSAFVAGLLVYAATEVLPISVSFAALAGYIPVVLVRARARNRRIALREIWPDVVDNIASAVRAGLSLPEALAQVGARGPAELRPAFTAFADDYRATGRFNCCLDELKERLADPVGDRLIESLRIARDVGGSDLGRLLRTLSGFLRDDARTRAELETRQGWTVNAARLAVIAPWVVLAMLCTRPDSARAYAGAGGSLVLLIGAVVSATAYRLMTVLGRLPEEERVLR
ncbi:tight adherence protein B [Austwickia chelonae]|uniref:Type II secretion system protein GspF domain-containing protein n=1 Tax=Austwickia chelonae NBRC 105200 TaxID=1184607 RepID=K6V820_9MICO|nr:type II secretion system F family protein [Austwickia chelonae]GAB78373.1 hypothetical protein AUCHE_08_06210 [Austwickia chelonae NBRC 105200]SEW02263.1 tight adherence protein B [Austwickia chelonae]